MTTLTDRIARKPEMERELDAAQENASKLKTLREDFNAKNDKLEKELEEISRDFDDQERALLASTHHRSQQEIQNMTQKLEELNKLLTTLKGALGN